MRRVTTGVLFLLVLAQVSTPVDAGVATSGAHLAVDPVAVVGPPPARGSDEAKADLAIVLWLQRTRIPDDVARAQREAHIGLDLFAAALGPGFDAAAYPRTEALLALVLKETGGYVEDSRDHFARPRPFVADSHVQPALKRELSFGYPSGHATGGIVYARVLAALVPARRDAILEVGRRIGYNRVLGGVHYPSDVLAGQRLGEALAEAMLATSVWRASLAQVRASEWSHQ